MQLNLAREGILVVMAAAERRNRAPLNASGISVANSFLDDYLIRESPSDFIQRSKTDYLVQDALSALLQARPEDPVSFLADYFGSFLEPKNKLIRAHERIKVDNYSSSIFENNLIDAYKDLNECDSIKNGLQGEDHNELLMMLTKDLPVKYAEQLLEQLFKPERQSVSFSSFRNDITTALMFKDFTRTALSLYQDIDFAGQGNAHRELCDFFLDELKLIVDGRPGSKRPSSILNSFIAKYAHAPYDAKMQDIMQLDEFVQMALQVFLRSS